MCNWTKKVYYLYGKKNNLIELLKISTKKSTIYKNKSNNDNNKHR